MVEAIEGNPKSYSAGVLSSVSLRKETGFGQVALTYLDV